MGYVDSLPQIVLRYSHLRVVGDTVTTRKTSDKQVTGLLGLPLGSVLKYIHHVMILPLIACGPMNEFQSWRMIPSAYQVVI